MYYPVHAVDNITGSSSYTAGTSQTSLETEESNYDTLKKLIFEYYII